MSFQYEKLRFKFSFPTYSKEKIKLENPNIRSTKRWLRELTLHVTSSRLVFLFLYQL